MSPSTRSQARASGANRSTRSKLDLNRDADRRQHADQSVETEQRDLAPHEVAHPRLSDAEQRGGLSLPQASLSNQLAQSIDELCP